MKELPLSAKLVREKRFRPSPVLYQFTWSVLVERDGNQCQHCRKAPPDVVLEIDHADGKKESWNLAQLRILCQTCNRSKKAPWPISNRLNEREREVVPDFNVSYEARRSLQLAGTFHVELNKLLLQGGLTVRDAENRLAKICGCDQQTVRRWIDRETTVEGMYELSSRIVEDKRGARTLQFISFRSGLEALMPIEGEKR